MESIMLVLLGLLVFFAGYSNREDGIYMVVGLVGLILLSFFAIVLAISKKRAEQKPMATKKRK